MKTQSFEIELEGEVAVGSPGSAMGGRDSLDYLPGSLFLGAAAARLYKELGHWAWPVFHGGKVRFNDGLPLSPSGCLAIPTPAALAARKDADVMGKGRGDSACAGELFNLARTPRTAQLDRARTPYLSTAGEKVSPARHYRLKTAIDPRSGVSMARQLYGYQSLAAGQTYSFTLEADDSLPDEIFAKLVDVLSGALRLGRSRSAEYGRCRALPTTAPSLPHSVVEDELLHVLLLSHLVIEDEYGTPTALPESTMLGLPPAQAVLTASFVSHGRTSIYNAAYRAFEADISYLERGSVLTYRMDPSIQEELLQRPLRYAGLQQQRGYGRLWLNPPILAGARFGMSVVEMKNEPEPKPDHPLAIWLQAQSQAKDTAEIVRAVAEEWYNQLAHLYHSAQVRAALAEGITKGPSPSQWGRVAEAAQQYLLGKVDIDRLMEILFGDEDGICRKGDPDWSQLIIDHDLEKELGEPPSFKNWLEFKLKVTTADFAAEHRVEILAHFARFAADRAKQRRVTGGTLR